MKQRLAVVFGGLAVLWLACAAAWLVLHKPYQVLEVRGASHLVASVVVPADAPREQLITWSYEIKLARTTGQPLLINYFKSKDQTEADLIASFSGPDGTLTDYREK